MTEDAEGRQRNDRKLWLALAALGALLLVLIVPPLVSVSHYQRQITRLMAASLGRPVRLSSVEVRLLPRPGFVLNNLTVEEDPAYGAEPVLHANTVTASIRLLSLWRGRLEISRIGVDEASLNLVRTSAGRWNLDSFFRTAAAKTGPAAGDREAPRPFPYLDAKNLRINFKNGAEKLPFSIVDADLSFSQEQPGALRIRLRGQPARTDLSLQLGDTGIVELDASVRRAPELRQIPVHLDMEWREAQLGQLARLMFGADPGWRGDLRGELHVDGTADAAQVKARLRAAGVHRAEFTPASPMDFDANCGLVYHYSERSVEKLLCDSPLGNGRIRLAGDLPGETAQPHFSVELDRIPVAAGLDALRTVRSGLAPGIEAGGTVSGKITYAEESASAEPKAAGRGHTAKAAIQGPLAGSFTVDGFQLSGGGLSQPLQAPKMVLEPAATGQALTGTAAIAAGGPAPLAVNVRLGLNGYQLAARGQASVARTRELAHATGLDEAAALDDLAGDPVTVDLSAEGPWMPAQVNPLVALDVSLAAAAHAQAQVKAIAKAARGAVARDAVDSSPATTDRLRGTVTLHNANWKANYLASHVEIAQATLHLDSTGMRWDPVVFSYGPLKGTASVTLPAGCDAPAPCSQRAPTTFTVRFVDLDAATVQTAILGAHEKGTLLSALIDRIHPSSTPAWPKLEGSVKAASVVLGPVTLRDVSAEIGTTAAGVEITGLDASLLGGRVHGAGTLETGDKPAYALSGHFEKVSPAALGQLLRERWPGGTIDADGKIELAGYKGEDLASSAKGTLHFVWRRGSVAGAKGTVPVALGRFGRWTADAAIGNGGITLGQNEVAGAHKGTVQGRLTFGEPPKMSFTVPKPEERK